MIVPFPFRRGGAFVSLVAFAAIAAPGQAGANQVEVGRTSKVSVSSDGRSANGDNDDPSISDDGTRVAFQSFASSLVPGDTNGAVDVFVRDLRQGTTTRVSVSSSGQQALGGLDYFSSNASISGDGRFVGFSSTATNLVPGDTNGVADVFVRDLEVGKTVRVSVTSAGEELTTNWNVGPSLSRDGRFVAFMTTPEYGGSSELQNIYVHDRDTDADEMYDEPGAVRTVKIVQFHWGGLGSISGSGRFVVFTRVDGPYFDNVYVHDRDADADGVFDEPGAVSEALVSVSGTGAIGTGYSASVSDNGRLVVFGSYESLVWPDANSTSCRVFDYWGRLVPADCPDIYLRDRDVDADGVFDEAAAVRTTRVNISTSGQQANEWSTGPVISGDGRHVIFSSRASNLESGVGFPCHVGSTDLPCVWGVYARDLLSGGTRRVDVSSEGVPTTGTAAGGNAVSVDGRFVAFLSSSPILTGGLGRTHVFARDRCAVLCA